MSEAAVPAVPAPATPERASLADWLTVSAGTLGALMAMVDVSIVNASLPTIQGEIGATPSEGTWIGTSYLIAEIVVIPLTAWLERLMGMRRLLLSCTMLFTFFSVICGLSTSLEMMVLGRIGQGLAGGVLIPTGLTIIARHLPPSQQALGLGIVAMTALLGPAIGPVLGGWLTENLSWHYAFFMNVPICGMQVAMLFFAMPKAKGDLRELRQADWFGVIGMVLGLGAATTLLEQGHREQWFDSTLIWQLAIAATLGFALIAIGQFGRRRPVIRLSLLANASLSSAVLLMILMGMLLFTCLFMVPQFLAAIAGYNALQAGQVAFIAAGTAVPVALVYPLLAKWFDARTIIAGAMLSLAVAMVIGSGSTVLTTSRDFVVMQMLYGIGTTLCAIPLQQVVLGSVALDDIPEANSMMAVARNLGGSIGLAGLAGFQDQRLDLHHWQLNASLAANDPEVQRQVGETAMMFGGGTEGLDAAMRAIDGQVTLQALVLTFNDMFLVLSIIGALSVPLVLFLRPPPRGASLQQQAMH